MTTFPKPTPTIGDGEIGIPAVRNNLPRRAHATHRDEPLALIIYALAGRHFQIDFKGANTESGVAADFHIDRVHLQVSRASGCVLTATSGLRSVDFQLTLADEGALEDVA
jgi:hypothetical protein